MKFSGKVIHGHKIASKFGVSTANLKLTDQNLDLDHGVYFVRVINLNKKGILHFGKRKTFSSEFAVEVHILDFTDNIYEEVLEIEVLRFERGTRKFPSPELLFEQIRTDVMRARKYFVRREIKAEWQKLTEKEVAVLASTALEKITQNSFFQKAKNVFIYAPIKYEIPFVFDLMKAYPEKNFAFPVLLGDELQFHFAKFEDLVSGAYGIPTPNVQNKTTCPNLIFVPALGADEIGNRLGRGKGFYDRFLKKCSSHKICVLPSFAIKKEIPVQDHDQKVDEVIAV